MTRLVSSAVIGDASVGEAFKISPDGKRLFVLTRCGNLDTGQNEYSLWLYDVRELAAFVNDRSKAALPTRHLLVRLATPRPEPAMAQVVWAGSEALTFIGDSGQATAQVFRVDISSRSVVQLSHHPTDVVSYAFSAPFQKLLYAAYAAPQPGGQRLSYVVGGETDLHDYSGRPRGAVIREIELLIADLRTQAVSRVDLASDVLARHIALSPGGRWAVIATTVRSLPAQWMRAQFLRPYSEQWIASSHFDLQLGNEASIAHDPSDADLLRNDAFGSVAPWIVQYRVIDLASGRAQTATDAPVVSTPSVAWVSDRRAVLGGVQVDSQTEMPTTIVIEVGDGDVRDVSGRTALKTGRSANRPAAAITLQVDQSINSPPDLRATDTRTGNGRVFTDLNPQLRELALGTMTEFSWTDRFATKHVGGLVYPPAFDARTPYPLVIQTYGFNRDEFLVDGPDGFASAYAARAIANEDILVLQAPLLGVTGWAQAGAKWRYQDDGEMPRFMAMVEGAIDALARQGLVDRDRVGVIGFSREGMRLHYLLAFSDYKIAAATIADSAAATPSCYSMVYGYSFPGMLEFEGQAFMGAPFWKDGIKTWMERSPVFHLDRINAPLRIETYSQRSSCHWDTFAILRRHRRPVEMVVINEGRHLLATPRARYESQQGNVEWFAFWLKGKHDAAPEKSQQYARWRALLQQRDALSCCRRPAPVLTGKLP